MKTPTYRSVKARTKRLTGKFTSDPVLPLLGWTKAAETVVTGQWNLLPRWTVYAVCVTVLWVAGVYLYAQVEDAADALQDAADDATDGRGEA
jgi:hypothetical protein